MGQAIEQFGGHRGITEDAGPLAEAQVGGDDDACALVEFAEKMAQQRTARGAERQVRSVLLSLTLMPGLPRRSIRRPSSRATRCPESDVSGIAARHSRVTSSTTFRIRNRRPQARWSWTKSNGHRALGRASTKIGARVPMASRRARECHELCVSGPVHAVSDTQASKRLPNIMAN